MFGTTTMSGEADALRFRRGPQRNTPVRDWKFFKRPLGVNSSKLIQLNSPIMVFAAWRPRCGRGPVGHRRVRAVAVRRARHRSERDERCDSIANGQGFGSASGVSYSVFAEAPDAKYPSEEAIAQRHEAQTNAELHRARGEPRPSAKMTRVGSSTDFNAPISTGPFRSRSTRSKVKFCSRRRCNRKAGDDPFFYTAGRASVSARRTAPRTASTATLTTNRFPASISGMRASSLSRKASRLGDRQQRTDAQRPPVRSAAGRLRGRESYCSA